MRLAILFVPLIWPSLALAQPCQKYQTGTIYGTVHRTFVYGPPNFGESPKTDQHGFVPFLKLDKPLHMCRDTDLGVEDEPILSREMQMIFVSPSAYKIWYGKHVEVTGDMFRAVTAGHHTDVMLDVKKIRVAR